MQDRQTISIERRADIEQTIQATIQELEAAEIARPSNGHRAPVALIVRTICHSFMYYSGQTMSNGTQPCRTSSDGGMEAYWQQYISERQWTRWKPRVLTSLAAHLSEYAPQESLPKSKYMRDETAIAS
jgi:hypothetical protein